MDIDTAVERADVGKQRRLAADARHGLVGVLFIVYRLVCNGLAAYEKRVYQQEKVRDHKVREPIILQIRQAVEHEKRTHRLLVDYSVNLHCEGLEAHSRIEPVLLHICAALAKRGCVHDLFVVGKAYVCYALALTGDVGYKSRCDVHIVADVLALPDDGITGAQKIYSLVKAVYAGAYAALFIHVFSSLRSEKCAGRRSNAPAAVTA